MTQEARYIWQHPSWPRFRWDNGVLMEPLGDCRFQQGSLLAQMRELGLEVRQQARAEVLIEEASAASRKVVFGGSILLFIACFLQLLAPDKCKPTTPAIMSNILIIFNRVADS